MIVYRSSIVYSIYIYVIIYIYMEVIAISLERYVKSIQGLWSVFFVRQISTYSIGRFALRKTPALWHVACVATCSIHLIVVLNMVDVHSNMHFFLIDRKYEGSAHQADYLPSRCWKGWIYPPPFFARVNLPSLRIGLRRAAFGIARMQELETAWRALGGGKCNSHGGYAKKQLRLGI